MLAKDVVQLLGQLQSLLAGPALFLFHRCPFGRRRLAAPGPDDFGDGQHQGRPHREQHTVGGAETVVRPRVDDHCDQVAGVARSGQGPGRMTAPGHGGGVQGHGHTEEDWAVGVAEPDVDVGGGAGDDHGRERPTIASDQRHGAG